ncbi:MAG: N-6 DNA methylase [Myxococcota bacterium]
MIAALHRRLKKTLPSLIQDTDDPQAAWRRLLNTLIVATFSTDAACPDGLRPLVADLSPLPPEDVGRALEGLFDLEARRAPVPLVRVRRGVLETVTEDVTVRGTPIDAGQVYLSANAGRKASGAYYTPKGLVDVVVHRTLNDGSRRILDPAMGAGHFLLGAVRAQKMGPGDVRQRLFGVDREPLAVALARWAIWRRSGGNGPLPPELIANLRCGDALTGALPDDSAQSLQGGARFGVDLPATFDAVVGNPPWEKVIPLEREFFSTFDARVLLAPTARERKPLIRALRQDPEITRRWERYAEGFEQLRRFVDQTYHHQYGGGHPDLYRYFLERAWRLLRPGGRLGMILPNAVYASAGAVGVRRMLLDQGGWEQCVGLINTDRIFDINRSHRFCIVVARRQKDTAPISVAFGLTDPKQLNRTEMIPLSRSFLQKASPELGTLIEVESAAQRDRLAAMMDNGLRCGDWMKKHNISLYQEMNMTLDSPRFTPSCEVLEADDRPRLEPLRSRLMDEGWLVVHEKGTFTQYTDRLKDQPRYLCRKDALTQGPHRPRRVAAAASEHFRLAARATIHTAERNKSCFAMLPPGVIVGNSALTEMTPGDRSARSAMILLAVANSQAFNEAARLWMGTNLNQFLLNNLPFPTLTEDQEDALVQRALRLTCDRTAFLPLWEALSKSIWHVPPTESEKQEIREEIDAIVEDGFGSKNG